MNKVIATMIVIILVISAIITGIIIFVPKYDNNGENQQIQLAEEEILDDCTDEYEGMEYESTVKANTQEEKTSPNCAITIKTYYKKCGHIKSEYSNLSEDLINLTKDQIQEKYKEYEIESFASNNVILYQEKKESVGNIIL